MPQHRKLLAADRYYRFEHVRSHAGPAGWSPAYRAPGCRTVFPATGASMLRAGAGELLVDGLTAFCLPAATAYQLRPQCADAARTHVVLSPVGDDAPAAIAAWLLSPAQLFQLRLLWKRLAAGRIPAVEAARIATRGLAAGRPLPAGGAGAGRVLRARAFLAGETGTDRGLYPVCEAACTSPFHLARLFREHTGIGMHQYRLRLRMATALARLDDGERDLCGLAHDLGFSSHSHFGALFRRQVGLTPAQARQAFASAGT